MRLFNLGGCIEGSGRTERRLGADRETYLRATQLWKGVDRQVKGGCDPKLLPLSRDPVS